jgi:VCBS repeat-containing protein
VTVTAVNDAPTCTSPVAVTAPEDGVGSGTLACADVDSASLTYSLVGAAAHGTAVVHADGSWTYIPVPDYTGPDTFTFEASDGSLDSATATANVTVVADTTAPVVTAPRVVFGSGRVDETAPLLVSWSATDTGVGVASYQVQVNVAGAGWKAVYTGPKTSITRSYAFGKTLVWRVRATDKASNTSGWVSSATRRLLAYQAPGSSAIKYTGTWTNVAQAASSGTGYRYVTTRYSKATLTFTGRAVLFVAPKTSRSGYVKVYVDGHLVGRYSEYRAASLVGQIVARASWGANGTHSIRISNDQSGRRANLDAFIVLR